MNKLIASIVCASFVYCVSNAQSLEMEVIGSAGNYSMAAWGSLSNTTGEAITYTFSNPSLVITQGFQQPSYFPTIISNTTPNYFEALVFPVPTDNKINISISNNGQSEIHLIEFYNAFGQRVNVEQIQYLNSGYNDILVFDVSNLPIGSYYIKLMANESVVSKTCKFIKI